MNWAIAVALGAVCLLIYGCIGPTSLSQERTDYDDQLAETGRRQLLLNILRIKNHELPQFVDVTQVNDSSTAGGSFTFGTNGMDTNHVLHDVEPSLSFAASNTPSITYSPLIGAGLVAQIAQPITVDSLAALSDSGWDPGTLLYLCADLLGPSAQQMNDISVLLTVLYDLNALVVVPTKSLATNGPGGDDSLTIYFDDSRAPQASKGLVDDCWKRLKTFFPNNSIDPRQIGIFPTPVPNGPSTDPSMGHADDYTIELRSVPSSQPSLLEPQQVIPALRTRSALGALMRAVDEDWICVFDSCTSKPTMYPTYYLGTTTQQIVPESFDLARVDAERIIGSGKKYKGVLENIGFTPSGIIRRSNKSFSDTQPTTDSLPSERQRYYILIHSDHAGPIHSANYVDCTYHGTHYWICTDDHVSQRNFELLGLLFTIQSQTSTTPPPYPAITVGSH